MGRGAALLQTSPHVFERVLAAGNPGRGWGRMLVLHINDVANTRFVQGKETTRAQGHEGSL